MSTEINSTDALPVATGAEALQAVSGAEILPAACGAETLPATRRLYEEDAFCRDFTAEILAVRPVSGENGEPDPDCLAVVLDRTAFFPEGGGQSADTGILAGCRVLDVRIRPDGVIEHIVAKTVGNTEQTVGSTPDLSGQAPETACTPGRTVTGSLDWERRFGFMQCHTGEHILSGLMHRQYGFDNIGFHLSDHSVTLDVNGQLSDTEIEALEEAANRVVWKDVPVSARFPNAGELETLVYRSKKEIEGPLRIVTVQDVDVCACCAPHVRRTGEIGIIRILRVLRYKGGMRLTIACGARALRYTQLQQRQTEQVSHLTNSPQENIADGVERVLGELEESRRDIRQLQERIADLCLENARPDRAGNVWIFEDAMSVITQRNLVNSLCAREEDRIAAAGQTRTPSGSSAAGQTQSPSGSAAAGQTQTPDGLAGAGYCGVFTLAGEKGYTYIVGSYGGADARQISRFLAGSLSARGGGSAAMVQGSVKADREAVRAALTSLQTPAE